MEPIKQHLTKRMDFHSEICEKHTHRKKVGSEMKEIMIPVQMLIVGDEIVCPRCEVEKENEKLIEHESEAYNRREKLKKYNTLFKKSLLEDKTLTDATLDNFKAEHPEEIENKAIVIEAINRIKKDQIINVILVGKQGTGKSHLAYASLKELNQMPDMNDPNDKGVSSAFINIAAMLRKIKDSFKNKESMFTEEYFIQLISSVDYLALDDLGAETGAIQTDKQASDFVQKILYAASTNRQGKSTFITTNLSSDSLFNIYDSKLVSRLFRNPKYIVFEKTKDKRMTNIPF